MDEKEKNRKNFVKTGRNRRQDHGTHGTEDRRKDPEFEKWMVSANHRRDVRHGLDEPIRLEDE